MTLNIKMKRMVLNAINENHDYERLIGKNGYESLNCGFKRLNKKNGSKRQIRRMALITKMKRMALNTKIKIMTLNAKMKIMVLNA